MDGKADTDWRGRAVTVNERGERMVQVRCQRPGCTSSPTHTVDVAGRLLLLCSHHAAGRP